MPASEFYECLLYERIEPFGERRADLRAGSIAVTVANSTRSKDTRPYRLIDFMLPWDPVLPRQQTSEQQMKIMLTLQQIQNAKKNG